MTTTKTGLLPSDTSAPTDRSQEARPVVPPASRGVTPRSVCIGLIFAAFFCAITIIGIPFAIAHVRLAGVALLPLGRRIVSIDEARALGAENAVIVERR